MTTDPLAASSLARAATALRWAGHLARYGCAGVGLALFAAQAVKLGTALIPTWGGRIELAVWAAVMLVGGLLTGFLADLLLRGLADMILIALDRAETSRRLLLIVEERLLPAVERLTASRAAETKEESVFVPSSDESRQLSPAAKARKRQRRAVRALSRELALARRAGRVEEVLNTRLALHRHLSETRRAALDEQLAQWMIRHFQSVLRQGKAAKVVDSLGRAVAELGHVPAMMAIEQSLPLIRQSVKRCLRCGRQLPLDAEGQPIDDMTICLSCQDLPTPGRVAGRSQPLDVSPLDPDDEEKE